MTISNSVRNGYNKRTKIGKLMIMIKKLMMMIIMMIQDNREILGSYQRAEEAVEDHLK